MCSRCRRDDIHVCFAFLYPAMNVQYGKHLIKQICRMVWATIGDGVKYNFSNKNTVFGWRTFISGWQDKKRPLSDYQIQFVNNKFENFNFFSDMHALIMFLTIYHIFSNILFFYHFVLL